MESGILKIKKLPGFPEGSGTLPSYATEHSAGLDLRAALPGPLEVAPGGRELVPTGIAIELPPGTVGLVCARSGLASKYGIALSNGVGVIDEDYRGELKVAVINLSSEPYAIEPGERIAQLLVMPVLHPEIEEVAELSDTARDAGGFGSSGKR